MADPILTLPSWFRQPLPDTEKIQDLKRSFREEGLHTVCESSRCPNLGACWAKGAATFMILGDICSRACRFCAVTTGQPGPVDAQEPLSVAKAATRLKLKYVVITSVTRDDLSDQGAGQFARTIAAIRASDPAVKVEVLVPDLGAQEGLVGQVLEAGPDVFSHNLETVERLSPALRPQADHHRSLDVLRKARRLRPGLVVKSGFMVGLGETKEEVARLMADLREAGCDILTIGQYLAPSKSERHVAVSRFVTPYEFASYREAGLSMGFSHVHSGPLVRTSYLAEEAYRVSLTVSRRMH